MKEKKVPPPAKPTPTAAVFADHQRHTCLQLDRSEERVEFIRLDVENGFTVETLTPPQFDQQFGELLADYPPERCARLYVGYARLAGATEEAMQRLGQLTTTTQEDIDMAAKKKAARTASPGPKAAAKGSNKDPHIRSHKDAPAKEAATKEAKTGASKAAGKPRAATQRGESASSMFKELIRDGKLTDDQIFAKVKAKFNLDDKKRGYVAWYRNDMRKKGEKVPDPVKAG